jgi:hypothetical protein
MYLWYPTTMWGYIWGAFQDSMPGKLLDYRQSM